MEWARVCAGTFSMGSPSSENPRRDEEALHEVQITRDFQILSTEVTQDRFVEVMGYNRSFRPGCGGGCPVENVSWHEAAAYCNALSAAEGLSPCYDCTGTAPSVSCASAAFEPISDCPGYRLPTEAEWEYAARAGDPRATYNGELDVTDDTVCLPSATLAPIAWHCGNSSVSYTGSADCSPSGGSSSCGPTQVALLEPNAWGLYDMLGNIKDWCHDWYGAYPADVPVSVDPAGPSTGSYRVGRGGSWFNTAPYLRAARREPFEPARRRGALGFRPVRTIAP